ncbi:MAG: hypothetical protein QME51_11740, partial [Planctomycetota bacterium]|nr:hypothetical protein [Planctomycetota bacterium]
MKQQIIILVLLASVLSLGFSGKCNLATDDSPSGSSNVLVIKANSVSIVGEPDSEISVPARAVDSDTEVTFIHFRQKQDLPEPLPDGCELLGGANLKPKHYDRVDFHNGKEADCYVVLPDNVSAEDLSNADIRLMEFIDLPDGQAGNQWVIVLPDKKGKVYTDGPKAGYIGPDESAPAKLTGIRPFCWTIIKDPAIILSLYNLWLTISTTSTTGGALPIISFPSVLNTNTTTAQPVITLPAPAVIIPPAQTSGLIGWWRLNEKAGSVAQDSSGNGNHGTVYGARWSSRYLSFDGVDDYVVIPNNPSL